MKNFKIEIQRKKKSEFNITTALAKITPKSTEDIFTSGQSRTVDFNNDINKANQRKTASQLIR